jgi:hypothetical protein
VAVLRRSQAVRPVSELLQVCHVHYNGDNAFDTVQYGCPGLPMASMRAMDKGILQRVLTGLSDRNIRFADLRNLVISMGFDERVKGDHHIFSKAGVAEIVNLQPLRDGMAKAYQVRQVRNLILKYKLHREGRDV